jgi:transposase
MHNPTILESQGVRPLRRSYTKAFKAELVAQCDRGERSLAQIAMDHQINANLVRKWQREIHEQQGSNKLVPVHVSDSSAPASAPGFIEISIGAVSMKVVGVVDSAYVASLLRALQ